MKFQAEIAGEQVPIEVTGQDGRYRVTVGGESREVDARQVADGIWSLLIEGASYTAGVSERDGVSSSTSTARAIA